MCCSCSVVTRYYHHTEATAGGEQVGEPAIRTRVVAYTAGGVTVAGDVSLHTATPRRNETHDVGLYRACDDDQTTTAIIIIITATSCPPPPPPLLFTNPLVNGVLAYKTRRQPLNDSTVDVISHIYWPWHLLFPFIL